MSDFRDDQPTPYQMARNAGRPVRQVDDVVRSYDMANRLRLVTTLAPILADKPDAAMAITRMNLSPDQLADHVTSLSGMALADDLRSQLETMTPGAQRAVWSGLTPEQQGALGQQGYMQPERDDDKSWWEKAIGAVTYIPRKITSAVIPDQVGDYVLKPALKGLTWVGDQPAHLYRAIRLGDDTSQAYAAGGAVIGGIAGGALAGATGGGSLAALGLVGGGGLLGGTAGSIIGSNPSDWYRAFNASWHGERTFDLPSQRRVSEMLGDTRLASLAHDFALSDADLRTVTEDFAEQGGVNNDTTLAIAERIASRVATKGTPEFQKAYTDLLTLAREPVFKEAVQTLVRGKISIGRDLADTIGLEPDSGIYNIVSGAVDGAFTVAVDPTLMVGGVAKWNKARREGMAFLEGSELAQGFLRIQSEVPRVRRAHELVVDFARERNFRDLRAILPTWRDIALPLDEHIDALVKERAIASRADFTLDHFNKWIIGQSNMEPILRGVGTVKGAKGVVLSGIGPAGLASRRIGRSLRAFTEGLSDPKMEEQVLRALDDVPTELRQAAGLDEMVPADLFGAIDESTGFIAKPWTAEYGNNSFAYAAGRALGTPIPIGGGRSVSLAFVGHALESFTTMIGQRAAVSTASLDEIHAFAESMRVTGMPAWARRRWEDAILTAENAQAKRKMLIGMLDNALTLSGSRATPRMEELINKYVRHEGQAYALGGQDTLVVGGERITNGVLPGHMAVELVMPDLHELRRASSTSWMAERMHVVNDRLLEPVLKVWRPAVLMRVGFIPRAAGEEMLNFTTRGGLGALVQGWSARAIGRRQAWEKASEKLRAGMKLDSFEEALIREGPLEGKIATLARMMDRTRWSDPRHEWLDRFADWTRKSIDADRPFRALAGGEFANIDSPTLLSAIRGEAPVLATARRNLATNLDSIVFGNPYSWRRMLLGGVNDDLVESATAMYTRHGNALLEAVTSRNSGFLDRGYDDQAIMHQRLNEEGEWENVEVVTNFGQHETIHRDSATDKWIHGMHESAAEVIHDYVLKDVWAEYLPRIAGGSGIRVGGKRGLADEKQLGFLRARYGNMKSTESRMVVDEFLGAPREESFRSMIESLHSVNPDLALTLKREVANVGAVDFDEVADAVAGWARRTGSEEAKAIAAEIREAKDMVTLIDKFPLAKRRFVGANLKSGSNAPLYRSWDDALDDMREAVKARLADARGQARTQRALPDPELRAGQVMVYVPPRIVPRADGAVPTFDDLVELADNRNVLYRNRETVERVLQHDLDPANTEWTALLADRQLADELNLVGARWQRIEPDVDALRVASFRDSILTRQGTAQVDMLAPLGPGENPAVWTINSGVLGDGRLMPVSRTLDDSIDRYADQIMGRARQVMTREVVEEFRPRMRLRDDGTATPVVFRRVGRGQVEPVTDAERVTGGRFINDKGETIEATNRKYFEPVDVTHESGDVPWELIGPMVEDAWDDLRGVSRWVDKQTLVPTKTRAFGKDELVPGGDLVRVFRSRVEHVNDAGPGLARTVIVPRRRVVDPRRGLDRVTDWAFDKGIGPAVDSLARRPMALHFFHERYQFAKRATQWTVPEELPSIMQPIIDTVVHAAYEPAAMRTLAGHTRALATFDGARDAERWTDAHALAWLRGHTDEELTALMVRTETRAARARNAAKPETAAARKAARYVAQRDFEYLRHALPADLNVEDFVAYARSQLPVGALEDRARFADTEVQAAIRENRVLRNLTDEDWKVMQRAERSFANIREAATSWASQGAIADMMPFIDSHRLKTQFSASARSVMPFWYAEENFIKRWARTVLLDPTSIRKAQLGYMGLKNTGVVQNIGGRDYVVVPGSQVLSDAIADTLGGGSDVGLMFAMPTDRMLPGINNRWGAPSFSPLVTIPVDWAQNVFPELAPVERAIAGDFANIPAIEQLVPGVIGNLYTSLFTDQNTNARYLSMMTNVIAQSLAEGEITDGASSLELDKWMNRIQDRTRAAMVAGGLLGMFTPAAPRGIVAGESASFLGGGIENPKQVLSSLYYDLVADLGIEQGTIEFFKQYPEAGLEEIVSPLALTVSSSKSKSGALLPATKQAVAFYVDNKDYFDEFPDAAPWLLPVDDAAAESRSASSAYDIATISGLRKQLTPDEFMRAIFYKQGAADYFESQEAYQVELEKANAAGDDERKRWLDEQWRIHAETYKRTHPVFAEELTNTDARLRRQRVIEQMRTVVQDPQAPESNLLTALRPVMQSWDLYQAQLAYARDDGTALGRAKVDWIKGQWQDYMTAQVKANPLLGSYWYGVLRPESDLS